LGFWHLCYIQWDGYMLFVKAFKILLFNVIQILQIFIVINICHDFLSPI
jgi:hypothetical protein